MSAAIARAGRILSEAGLRGAVLARELRTGHELALEPDRPFPLASVVKLPLAAAVLDRAVHGEVDLSTPVTIGAAERSRGGPGLARFLHPATIGTGDLVTLALELSDNSAADALFRLVPPAAVTTWLRTAGVRDLVVRHPIEELYASLALRTESADAHAVTELVVAADANGYPSPLPQLDLDRANVGTARALADLLERIWDGSTGAGVADPLRRALAGNVMRHRLTPDFASDAVRWSSKTGTFIHLRHEAGVAEHEAGEVVVVVALTASRVPALTQPAAEQAIGHAARTLHDEVLRTLPPG